MPPPQPGRTWNGTPTLIGFLPGNEGGGDQKISSPKKSGIGTCPVRALYVQVAKGYSVITLRPRGTGLPDFDLPPGTSPLSKLDLGPFEVHSMV